ncbi:MAG: DUF5615 family PIN-like protein [Rubrobacteraceae bacterium]
MKVKLDENLGNRSIELFGLAGHDVVTVEEQNLASAPDRALIGVCREESRSLVTLDLDFSNVLVFPPSDFAGIAVLRVPHPVTLDALHEHVRTLLRVMETRELAGKLWIVETGRIREYAPDS